VTLSYLRVELSPCASSANDNVNVGNIQHILCACMCGVKIYFHSRLIIGEHSIVSTQTPETFSRFSKYDLEIRGFGWYGSTSAKIAKKGVLQL